jgi:hypothetical protein
MSCEDIRGLLALSAAGALDTEGQRRLAGHIRECAACADELAIFDAIAGALGSLPVPQAPPGLVYRTQLEIAIEADRRQGARLAIGAGMVSWLLTLITWRIALLLGGSGGAWVWVLWCSAAAGLGSAAVAVLTERRRLERRWQ